MFFFTLAGCRACFPTLTPILYILTHFVLELHFLYIIFTSFFWYDLITYILLIHLALFLFSFRCKLKALSSLLRSKSHSCRVKCFPGKRQKTSISFKIISLILCFMLWVNIQLLKSSQFYLTLASLLLAGGSFKIIFELQMLLKSEESAKKKKKVFWQFLF